MSRTIAQINEYARSLTGYEKNSDSDEGFISDTFILSSIHKALAYMADEQCFPVTGYIQLIANQKEYVLPDTFIELVENEPIFIYNEDTQDEISTVFVTQMTKAMYDRGIPSQGSITSGNVLIGRRENKLIFENYTPTTDDTSCFLKIHFYREHEDISEDTETPYRIHGPSQRLIEDYVISDIYKRDKEYSLSEKHESAFYALVKNYKTKQLNNTVRQSKVSMASNYRGGGRRSESYDI